MVVNAAGAVYVSNYYGHEVGSYTLPPPIQDPLFSFSTLISNVDPLDGPCGLALDAFGRLYVNNYHRNVERYSPVSGGFSSPTVIDSSTPTGVAVQPGPNTVYVNARTYITAYDSAGAPIMNGPDPLRIGLGSLGDGYGLAVSGFPATNGFLYAPDHASDTVKVYDPLTDIDDPVQTITGPPGGFGSLRDSAVAVDRVSGEVYVADTLAHPQYTERPEAIIHVFDSTGTYKGRLKYAVIDGSPPGLAVDNSLGSKQGRVYVTSGNTSQASFYAYPPGSATNQSAPASLSLAMSSEGDGEGRILGEPGIECETACQEQVRAGATVVLTATSEEGSVFKGWSGAGCEGAGPCPVRMNEDRAVFAEFAKIPQSIVPRSAEPSSDPAASASEVIQKNTLRVTTSSKLTPQLLPRQGTAPIAVSIGGKISTTDSSLPPQLESMRIELNQNGRLDWTGLPTCPYARIQPGSTARALASCSSALVGKGSFTADITLAGQNSYPTKGRLLVFHGVEGGRHVLLGHIYSAAPFATSFVIVFAIRRLSGGTYGTALEAALPQAMDAWGRLTGLEMTLSRRYSHKGKAHSFISAGCPAPKGFPGALFPLARTSFKFEGGPNLTQVLSNTCKAKG